MERKGDTRLVRKLRGGLGALLAALLLVPIVPVDAVAAGSAGSASAGRPAGAACDPAMVVLPAETETAGAALSAMNDAGLVAGVSFDWEQDIPAHVVVWDAMEPPTDVGIGGVRRADGSSVSGQAVDVNEAGVVAAQRYGFSARGKGKPSVPVYWRDGDVRRLPIPRGATGGFAVDNNNRGLIVGQVSVDRGTLPWWWRRGGQNGPLSIAGLKSAPFAVAVDDRDRVIGERPLWFEGSRSFLWRRPSARPRHILGADGGATAMSDTRHVVGHNGGFRGISDRAWVARLGDRRATSLPDPPLEDPDGWWANTFARAVIRGVTAFAPQGGITVGGTADTDGESPVRAVLWTCAQAYLE